jgi:hypothetical protein
MAEGGNLKCIPVIDMQEIEDLEQYKKLREASEEWGCFRIVNHKIPASLMSEMKKVVKELLDLPMEIKKRNTDVIAGSGYVAPSNSNPLYEALGLYDLGSPEAVRAFCSQLDASPQQRFLSLLITFFPSNLLSSIFFLSMVPSLLIFFFSLLFDSFKIRLPFHCILHTHSHTENRDPVISLTNLANIILKQTSLQLGLEIFKVIEYMYCKIGEIALQLLF